MNVSVSNLGAPIPSDIPGLEAKFTFDTDKPLNPLAVYMNAIHLMYELSKHPWDDVLQRAWVTCELGYGLVISLKTSRFLQTRYMILSLYQSVLAMTEARPGFYRLKTEINLFEKDIGRIEFKKVGDPWHEIDTIESDDSTANGNSTVLTVLQTPIVDREDQKFIIDWQDDGANIPVGHILFAAFDGLATVAQYDQDTSCGGIHGVSVMADAVLFLGPYHDQSLPCGRIRRALLLIVTEIVIGKKSFCGMEFGLKIDGTQVGQGYLLKMPSRVGQINSTRTLATS